jgi:hypothetical protein
MLSRASGLGIQLFAKKGRPGRFSLAKHGKTWQNPRQNNPRVNLQKDVSNYGWPAGSYDLLIMVGKLHIRVNVYSFKKGRPSIKFGFNQWDVTSSKHGDAPKKEGSKKT